MDHKLSNAIPLNAVKDEGHCIWYGPCEDCKNDQDKTLNVAYNGPAKALEPEDEDSLKTLCPELFEGHGKLSLC